MDTAIQVAIIGALITLFAALLATLIDYYRERSEKERWCRTLELEAEKWRRNVELEEQRLRHEEVKWALDLNNEREIALHEMRLRTYPEVLTALGKLSHHNLHLLTEEQMLELADKFNAWGYGDAGLCMLPDTRDAVFVLRRSLVKAANKEIEIEDVMRGPRTDLVELLRRDANHDWSRWRDLETLTDVNRERVRTLQNPD